MADGVVGLNLGKVERFSCFFLRVDNLKIALLTLLLFAFLNIRIDNNIKVGRFVRLS